MLNNLDGYEVCRAVKSNPATKNVPVILLSAKGRNVDQKMGFDVGAIESFSTLRAALQHSTAELAKKRRANKLLK